MPIHEPTITTKKITHYILECCGVVLYNGPEADKAYKFAERLKGHGQDTELKTPSEPTSDGKSG